MSFVTGRLLVAVLLAYALLVQLLFVPALAAAAPADGSSIICLTPESQNKPETTTHHHQDCLCAAWNAEFGLAVAADGAPNLLLPARRLTRLSPQSASQTSHVAALGAVSARGPPCPIVF